MERIAIVNATNDAFVPVLQTLHTSLLQNNSTAYVDFFIVDNDLSFNGKGRLAANIAHFPNAAIHFETVSLMADTDFVESNRIPKTAYYRLMAPCLFQNSNFSRLLYLDCDMVVTGNIMKLWQTDLAGNVIGAVEDAGNLDRFAAMGLDTGGARYFNSGLLLIDLERWRQEKITSKVMAFIRDHPEKLKYHDQDALNAVLYSKWYQLHPRFNAQSDLMLGITRTFDAKTARLNREARQRPTIIHYCGHVKPWHSDYQHADLQAVYRYYAQRNGGVADGAEDQYQ